MMTDSLLKVVFIRRHYIEINTKTIIRIKYSLSVVENIVAICVEAYSALLSSRCDITYNTS